MQRIGYLQWLFILAACAFVVFLVGAVSLYIKFKLPDLLPEDVNDSNLSWAFGVFWAIHAPLIFILSRHFSFDRRHLAKSLLVAFSAGIFWAMFVQGLPLMMMPFLKDSIDYNVNQISFNFIDWFGANFLPNLFIYWSILSICLISAYYESYQKELLKASELNAQLSTAWLQALKMQLQPHFLFNTLHSVSALILTNENRDAVKMINRLSELLRLTLDNIETQSYSLADEIKFTRRYLEIETIRFRDRLAVEWKIEPPALTAEVPALILQPLVENAMRHGVDSNPGASRIQIAAQLQNGQLLMEVRDDGCDFEKITRQHNAAGLGLKNTRARLAELYGENYSFTLSRNEKEWTIARVVIPLFTNKIAEGERH
jgi:two-component system, LytTR family, sensor kinase